jgi:hypothetical protein
MDKDIASILEGWEYVPNRVVSRRIKGRDGREKVQLRLEMGLLQMEVDGRPDGLRPHDSESLLEYHKRRFEEHKQKDPEDVKFHLTVEQCQDLQSEGIQYYYRYLALFHADDYSRVIRDTKRNLELLDFIYEYATKDWDREILEQFRPYILMMNTRAHASMLMQIPKHQEALDVVVQGLDAIRRHFESIHHPESFEKAKEVVYLRSLADDIVKAMPKDPVKELRDAMQLAVEREDYEHAARLRDQIKKLENISSN